MASKPRNINPDYYYHVYNRGVEKRNVFLKDIDYLRFLETLNFYKYKQAISFVNFKDLGIKKSEDYKRLNPQIRKTQIIHIVAYCLMPNHFHLILKPIDEMDFPKFISLVSNSYTKYFNIKCERVGALFQGKYKCKEVTDDEVLLHLVRYVHINPNRSPKVDWERSPEEYPYSSYSEWLSPSENRITSKEYAEEIIEMTGGVKKFKEFINVKIDKPERALGESITLETSEV